MKKIIILMSICLLTLSTSVSAQEPTLQQTVDYIINRVTLIDFEATPSEWYRKRNVSFENVLIIFDENKGVLRIKYKIKSDIILKIRENQYVPKIDESIDEIELNIKRCNISIDKRFDGIFSIEFTARKENESISKVTSSELSGNIVERKREVLNITKDSDPEKVLKAFHHLQKLLGVKDDSDMF